jgi:hypothetical protein
MLLLNCNCIDRTALIVQATFNSISVQNYLFAVFFLEIMLGTNFFHCKLKKVHTLNN